MRAARFNSLAQLAAVMAGFVVVILLLESEALLTWADRLDVGTARVYAVAVATVLHKSLQPFGIEQVRRDSLTDLDRLGWTDDPARLLAAREKFSAGAALPATACLATTRAPNPVTLKPALTHTANLPPLKNLPELTPLAPLPPAAQCKPRVVALVGDSMMAVGLSDVLLRQTAGNQNLHVIKAFRSGTGLARPDVFDWTQEYPAMVGAEKPDAIIVAIGANDGQGFVEDGKTLAYGSDAWVKTYQQRIGDFLDLLTQNGAHVVWVGLPPMKSGAYNNHVAQLNQIAYSVVSQNPQATWWNPQPYIGDENGGFREFLTAPDGRTTRIRSADGIHLSDEGAALLAPSLLQWINPAPTVDTAQNSPPENPQNAANRPQRRKNTRASRH
jgi:uncharacterized protein